MRIYYTHMTWVWCRVPWRTKTFLFCSRAEHNEQST